MKKQKYSVGTTKKRNNIIIFVVLIFLVISILAFIILGVFNKDEAPNNASSNQKDNVSPAKNSSNVSSGDKQATQSTTTKTDVTVKDNSGTINSIPDQSKWLVSKDGVITVYSPTTDTQIKNGSLLTGKTSATSVSFRLIDNLQGMISQGKVNVVNGNFSATFKFSTTATQGRLDVYVENPDFTESSIIEVPIRF